MKASVVTCAAALAGLVVAISGPASAQTCLATCNTAHDQCASAGKNETICLNAWHQCRTGCSTSAAPKLQVTRPSANTVVIKTVPAKKP